MTPAAKITYLLALIIGLSIGAFFGFSNASLILKAYYSSVRLTAPSTLDDFSFMQYRHADSEHARIALLTSAGFLEKLEALSPDKLAKLILANTYIQLALLEDSAHNTRGSQEYMTKARYWYVASGGQNYSDSEMKAAVNTSDERLQSLGIR